MDTDKQSFELEGIGKITIKRRRGQKTTTLRMSRRGDIILGTNYSTPLYMLKKFALQNRAWLGEVRGKSGLTDEIEIFDGQVLSKDLRFKIVKDAKRDDLDGSRYRFGYRKGSEDIFIKAEVLGDYVILDNNERSKLDKVVIRALREKAKLYLSSRLKEISDVMGTEYNTVTIRDTSSRWGSCSSNNDINLSLWLMILPGELIDYVVVHELAHTRFKHHGRDFWEEVAKWCPNHKALRAKLKKYSAQVWW